jgi:hypothetical protein
VDPNATPPAQEHDWSETRFFACFDHEVGAGLFVHAGRCMDQLDLWWVHLAAYLPDGRLAVERIFGRPTGTDLDFAGLDWRNGLSFQTWECSYEGAAEITTPAALAVGVGGAGLAVPMSWRMAAQAAFPVFEPQVGDQDWAHLHNEQGFRCEGLLTVGGETWPLDAVCVDDHSTGPRELSVFEGHHWMVVQFPERVLHAMWIRSGGTAFVLGTMLPDGDAITTYEAPLLDDALGAPTEFEAMIGGERYRIEILHILPVSATNANGNLIGVDHARDDLVVFAECPIRATASDGSIGYGHLERSARREALQQPRRQSAGHLGPVGW